MTYVIFCTDSYCILSQPVLEEEKQANGKLANGKLDPTRSLNSTYLTSEFSEAYKPCYSNGSTNGFVSQSFTHRNGRKID